MKCEFNGNTVFSRFDAAHPEDQIPIEVRSINFYGRERARMDRTIWRRSARYNVPADPASWTVARSNIPLGTAVIDHRMSPETRSRETWYWDGTGLSTNRPSNRAQLARERRSPPDPTKLLTLAEKDPQSPFALEAATWIILNTSDGPEIEKAAEIGLLFT